MSLMHKITKVAIAAMFVTIIAEEVNTEDYVGVLLYSFVFIWFVSEEFPFFADHR